MRDLRSSTGVLPLSVAPGRHTLGVEFVTKRLRLRPVTIADLDDYVRTLRRDAWGRDTRRRRPLVHPDNERSARLARRLGMSELRTDVLLDTPVVVYWLSRAQYAR